jgi:hypothetical protein
MRPLPAGVHAETQASNPIHFNRNAKEPTAVSASSCIQATHLEYDVDLQFFVLRATTFHPK